MIVLVLPITSRGFNLPKSSVVRNERDGLFIEVGGRPARTIHPPVDSMTGDSILDRATLSSMSGVRPGTTSEPELISPGPSARRVGVAVPLPLPRLRP